jgi:hypothetical protein
VNQIFEKLSQLKMPKRIQKQKRINNYNSCLPQQRTGRFDPQSNREFESFSCAEFQSFVELLKAKLQKIQEYLGATNDNIKKISCKI